MIENLIRGGQITAHKYRMGRQILRLSFVLYLLLGFSLFGIFTYKGTTAYDWYLLGTYYKAEVYEGLSFAKAPGPEDFYLANGSKIKLYPKQIIQNRNIQASVGNLWSTLENSVKKGFLYGLAGFVLMLLFFILNGRRHTQTTRERGRALLSPKSLERKLRALKQASDLTLDDFPLLKDKETEHFLITGSTGSGKTNCFNTIIPQIRRRNDKAIIVDMNGEFTARYYNPDQDILMNPLDGRSQHWNLWLDCTEKAHYSSLVKAIIPGNSHQDGFWDKASRTILQVALEKFAKNQNPKELYKFLTSAPMAEFERFFKGTEAASLTNKDGEKMTLSIRANLSTQLAGLDLLRKIEEGFSFRHWVQTEKPGWLFLTTRPDQRELLKPLITAWVDLSMNALMTLNPDPKRRLWFVMDELPALQELPSLQTLLAESRKYGGLCCTPKSRTLSSNF